MEVVSVELNPVGGEMMLSPFVIQALGLIRPILGSLTPTNIFNLGNPDIITQGGMGNSDTVMLNPGGTDIITQGGMGNTLNLFDPVPRFP